MPARPSAAAGVAVAAAPPCAGGARVRSSALSMAQQDEDFAAMFEATERRETSRGSRKLRVGEPVDGIVVAIGKDSIFIDVGAKSEARIARDHLADDKGNLTIGVGDRVRARVASVGAGGIELVTTLGRRGGVDVAAIEIAHQSGAPIEGTFSKTVKGGLEVEIGGVRAFCPASQVDLVYMQDFEPLVGQRVAFKVVEVRDGGRSVIVSRKAVLQDEREARAAGVRERLQVGAELDGVIQAIQPYGAFVDIGGLEGLVHVSELGHGRVEKVEDVVRVGEQVKVRVIAIEPRGGNANDLKISLSMRSASEAAAPIVEAAPEELLAGKVAHVTSFGVFVDTDKGRGLVPLRELGLPPGADPKRTFPAGKDVQVVVLSRDAGKLRFSISGVARAEERSNYRDFAQQQKGGGGGEGKAAAPTGKSLGSLGDLLRGKLGEVPDAPATKPATRTKASPAKR